MPNLPAVDRSLSAVALVVREYDEAIEFFTRTLGFHLLEDTPLGKDKRWVRVAPRASGTSLLLARAATAEQRESIGRQTGGRVFLFLETADFAADHERFRLAGVKFVEGPREESYGTVAVFLDLYGNRWDLIERRDTVRASLPPLEIVDLAAEGNSSTSPYRNIVVNRVNDHALHLATFEGTYPWHVHPDSDELFIVVSGELAIDFADGRSLLLSPWQMATLPAGVVHRTRAMGRVVNLTFEHLATSTIFLEPGDAPS